MRFRTKKAAASSGRGGGLSAPVTGPVAAFFGVRSASKTFLRAARCRRTACRGLGPSHRGAEIAVLREEGPGVPLGRVRRGIRRGGRGTTGSARRRRGRGSLASGRKAVSARAPRPRRAAKARRTPSGRWGTTFVVRTAPIAGPRCGGSGGAVRLDGSLFIATLAGSSRSLLAHRFHRLVLGPPSSQAGPRRKGASSSRERGRGGPPRLAGFRTAQGRYRAQAGWARSGVRPSGAASAGSAGVTT